MNGLGKESIKVHQGNFRTYGLKFNKYNNIQIIGYSYTDIVGDPNTRKSTTGACIFVGGNLISLASKKQNIISRSIVEAEYRSLTFLSGEVKLMVM